MVERGNEGCQTGIAWLAPGRRWWLDGGAEKMTAEGDADQAIGRASIFGRERRKSSLKSMGSRGLY
ncbi:hypothetical protein Dimus_020476, partial [Dionaea muscipula]